MVMHARKPQRISDGYFEKHQAHPYQKYNSKSERRAASEYVSADNRYSPLRSPNGNVSAHGHGHTGHSGHGHHHYSHCVEERGYTSRNTYIPKGCEKERDRDYKSSREKYTDCVISPKEKRSKDIERERSNHERSDMEKKSRAGGLISVSRSNKYDKRIPADPRPAVNVPAGSEWSEHISSSGKKYYYNCVSEVSQWEKPREWDPRRTLSKDTTTYSSRSNHDKRTNSVRESVKPSKRTNSGSDRYWNSGGREDDGRERSRPKHEGDGQSLQDMDISPDRSTPRSEHAYPRERARAHAGHAGHTGHAGHADHAAHPVHAVPPVVVLDHSHQTTGSLLAAALPRIVSAPPAPAHPHAHAASGAGGAGPAGLAGLANNGGGGGSPGVGSGGATPHRDAGPPTPTHSENTDPHAPPLHLETALPRKMECLGSYSSVVGSTLHHAMPMLTPSLANYMRPDLTHHVAGWPADLLEKQAHRYTEDAYQLGCMQCTRVAAELKCTRSLVRHTEIQATLQEQKIMYLRQQIARLEELKSQNSFMSDE